MFNFWIQIFFNSSEHKIRHVVKPSPMVTPITAILYPHIRVYCIYFWWQATPLNVITSHPSESVNGHPNVQIRIKYLLFTASFLHKISTKIKQGTSNIKVKVQISLRKSVISKIRMKSYFIVPFWFMSIKHFLTDSCS